MGYLSAIRHLLSALINIDDVIQRIPFHRSVAGRADEAHEVGFGHGLRGSGSGVVINFLFDDRPVEIVSAEGQGHLREFGREHDPIGFDVPEVVEQDAGDGERFQIIHAGRPLAMQFLAQVVFLGMERERDEGLKTAGLVLLFTQAQEMIYPMLVLFDVPIEHGGVRPQAQAVCLTMNGEPRFGVRLLRANFLAHVPMEDFGPAAGHGVQPRRDAARENFFVREAG